MQISDHFCKLIKAKSNHSTHGKIFLLSSIKSRVHVISSEAYCYQSSPLAVYIMSSLANQLDLVQAAAFRFI
uniref:Uncharacterized protein n=1 Tax=Arundo donax TaxID=35708 RepID=A0A0A9EWM3_ARUDO